MGYSRRFVASVTASLNKYRDDPFFRTEVHIVVLQISFALVIVALISFSSIEINQSIDQTIREGIHEAVRSNGISTVSPAVLAAIDRSIDTVQTIRFERIEVIVMIILVLAIIFSAVVSGITLAPARNALTTQKQFIGNIAHELRTPLSVIKTNSEIMLLDRELKPEVRDTFESNVEELDRISEIINNLLTLSALIRPGRIEFEAVDLSGIAVDAIEKYKILAQKNHVNVSLEKHVSFHAWGNATALRQITENILKNAVVYTPRSGQVAVLVAPSLDERYVELTVRDSGIGIARKDLMRIFEPFYRSDPSRARGQSGSGLGLTITNELVKLHGGKISVRSAVGQGTTVTVFLPAYRPEKDETVPARLDLSNSPA